MVGTELSKPLTFAICEIGNCGRQAVSRGMCSLHRRRWDKGKRGIELASAVQHHDRICSVNECSRPVLAKGLCNAHYIRKRKGIPLDGDVEKREKVTRTCKIDGCTNQIGEKGAKDLCPKHFKRAQRKKIWEQVIAIKGGKCARCGGVFPHTVYDLHHRDPGEKEFSISDMIGKNNVRDVLLEAEKCDLLCANCHRLEHYGDGSDLY